MKLYTYHLWRLWPSQTVGPMGWSWVDKCQAVDIKAAEAFFRVSDAMVQNKEFHYIITM